MPHHMGVPPPMIPPHLAPPHLAPPPIGIPPPMGMPQPPMMMSAPPFAVPPPSSSLLGPPPFGLPPSVPPPVPQSLPVPPPMRPTPQAPPRSILPQPGELESRGLPQGLNPIAFSNAPPGLKVVVISSKLQNTLKLWLFSSWLQCLSTLVHHLLRSLHPKIRKWIGLPTTCQACSLMLWKLKSARFV